MLRMVVAQGLRLVAAGVVAGVGASLLSARVVRTVVFGISPSDPRVLLAVALALTIVAAIACALPARRAARLDPAVVLRDS
jgi:ABC-type antimicrobial peptide transport system permease subunit